MIEPTKIALPGSVKFPVVITGLLLKPESDVEKHTPLLSYKYWDYVEEMIGDEEDYDEGEQKAKLQIEVEEVPESTAEGQVQIQTKIEGDILQQSSESSSRNGSRKSTSPSPSSRRGSDSETHRVRKEFHSSFEAPVKGVLHEYLVKQGDEVENFHQPVVSIVEPCTHSVQYGGLCALCGSSLDEQDYTEFNNTDRAPIAMTHDTSGLKVSYNEAERIEKSSSERLLSERKLILVVDLDQTVIHAAVDPTIGDWMRDVTNPNHSALKDVKTFCLEETLPILPRASRGEKSLSIVPPTTLCWYYVKLRPGLDEFLKSMAELYEMHIYTMATKSYAKAIANIIDPDGKYFSDRILSRDDSGSLLQKSLKRLFPVSTSMVAIIDDRGDVWKWSNNLIKVVPYNFFVGIGDINSSFLPQLNGAVVESSMKKSRNNTITSSTSVNDTDGNNSNDSMDLDKESSSISTETGSNDGVDESEENDDNKENELIDTDIEASLELELSPVDQLVAIAGGEDNAELLSVQASERSASLELQQLERPLAKLQKDLERKHHHHDSNEEDKGYSDEGSDSNKDNHSGNESNENNNDNDDNDPETNESDHLLIDNDNELVHLENALRRVHEKYYDVYDRISNKNKAVAPEAPDLTEIIPQIKSHVFNGCVFLFSGVVPLGRNFDTCDIVQWVRSFGAVVVADLIDSVTHVIATSGGTVKVRMAAGHPNIKIVYTDWVYACIAAWNRRPEDAYLIHVSDPIFPSNHETSRLIKGASQQPEESVVEKFRQSLTDGDIDWDEADKELEEFMASDEDEADGDEDDDENNSEDSDENNDEEDAHDNKNSNNDNDHNNHDESTTVNHDSSNSKKRQRSVDPLEEPTTKNARVDDDDNDNINNEIDDEENDSYDDDEFAKELENDLM